MKTLLLMSSLLVTSALSAQTVHPRAKAIATLRQVGGFCPDTCPSTSLTINDYGQVVLTTSKSIPVPSSETKVLLTLTPATLVAIQKDIRSIQPDGTTLTDLDQDQPFCADIPTTLYTVVQGNQKIDIGKDESCHKYRLSNFQGVQLTDTLRNFLQLSWYVRQQQ